MTTIWDVLDEIEARCPDRSHECRGLRIALRDGLSTTNRRLRDLWRHCVETGGDWTPEEREQISALLRQTGRVATLGAGPGYRTVAQVAERLGIDPSAVRHAVADGRVPAVRVDARTYVIPEQYADPATWEATKRVSGRPRGRA